MQEIKKKNENLAEAVNQLAKYVFSITGIEAPIKHKEGTDSIKIKRRKFQYQDNAPKKCKPN